MKIFQRLTIPLCVVFLLPACLGYRFGTSLREDIRADDAHARPGNEETLDPSPGDAAAPDDQDATVFELEIERVELIHDR